MEIGYLIKAQLRLIDYAFRYGGDEFVVLLPKQEKMRHWWWHGGCGTVFAQACFVRKKDLI